MISYHAKQKCQARGIKKEFLKVILSHADIDHPIGDNCRLLRVSKKRAWRLNVNDRLGRYAVIWSDDNAQVVTILPMHSGAPGAHYRKIQSG
jgi:hypothetical protein